VQLPAWPTDDHTTRIVFITQGIPPEALRNSLDVLASGDGSARYSTVTSS
jgi:hypothetical protein